MNFYEQKAAYLRARRNGSSAPTYEDLKLYSESLKKAIGSKKKARVLVLGATPELRDLAISCGCDTFAIDKSFAISEAMHKVMKYKDDPRNRFLLCDWLEMDKFLQPHQFDAALADASLNNIPIAYYAPLFSIVRNLLKKQGIFITRHMLAVPSQKEVSISDFQTVYNERKTYWLMFWIALGYYNSAWRAKVYNKDTHQISAKAMFTQLSQSLQKGELKFRKEDEWKIQNLIQHAKNIIHSVMPKPAFESLVKRYFTIESAASTKWVYADSFPIYTLKARRAR